MILMAFFSPLALGKIINMKSKIKYVHVVNKYKRVKKSYEYCDTFLCTLEAFTSRRKAEKVAKSGNVYEQKNHNELYYKVEKIFLIGKL